MPQVSYAYAVGRVRGLENGLIKSAQMDRILSATSFADVGRALSEIGWVDTDSAQGMSTRATKNLEDACALVRKISPCSDATDGLLLPYDITNLKALFKARTLNHETPPMSHCGIIDVDKLVHAVRESRYTALPDPIKNACNQVERALSVTVDPLTIDATLDGALFEMTREMAERVSDPVIKTFYAAKADAANALTLLRAVSMGKDKFFARKLLVPGGEIPTKKVADCAGNSEALAAAFAMSPIHNALRLGLRAAQDGKGYTPLEKHLDDALMHILREHRYTTTGVVPVMGYLLARQRESSTVRMALAALNAGVPVATLRERMRELYA